VAAFAEYSNMDVAPSNLIGFGWNKFGPDNAHGHRNPFAFWKRSWTEQEHEKDQLEYLLEEMS
jgi:hypothetical protein